MPGVDENDRDRTLSDSPEELRSLLRLCREGRLYDVEHWIADVRSLQLRLGATPRALDRRRRYRLPWKQASNHSRASYYYGVATGWTLDVALQARRCSSGRCRLLRAGWESVRVLGW